MIFFPYIFWCFSAWHPLPFNRSIPGCYEGLSTISNWSRSEGSQQNQHDNGENCPSCALCPFSCRHRLLGCIRKSKSANSIWLLLLFFLHRALVLLKTEITGSPALGTVRLIARKMLYVKCVGLCIETCIKCLSTWRKRLMSPIILTVTVVVWVAWYHLQAQGNWSEWYYFYYIF